MSKVSPNHYENQAIQPLAFITANKMGFAAGNVIKYVTRYRSKNGVEDLQKARMYLDVLIHEEQNEDIDWVKVIPEMGKRHALTQNS